jgi:hypothetical protein
VLARHWPGSTTPTPPGTARLDGDHYLHALKLSDGSDRLPARKIDGHDPVTNRDFEAFCQRNRPGLLLLNGIVYVGFGTFSCDGGPYRGWVLGYTADKLQPAAIFCTSTDVAGSGVWQSGNGLVGTEDGSIYFETGNDINPTSPGSQWQAPPPPPLADSFVRLQVLPKWPGLQQVAHFQLANALRLRDGDRDAQGNAIDGHWGDTDLGSGGPVRLPGLRLIGGGKQGRYYVLDAGSLQLTQDTTSPDPAKIGQGFQAFVNNDRNVPADRAENFQVYGAAEGFGPNIHGGPCYWRGPSYLYQMPEKDYLKAFSYDLLSGLVQQTPVRTATVRPGPGMPGGHSSVSANGDRDGIVWTLLPTNDGQWSPTPGSLHAFDGLTLRELWADLMPEWFAKFNPPTIADGKVFRPVFPQFPPVPGPDDGRALAPLGPGKVIVYGLLTHGNRPPGSGHWRRWVGGADPEPRFTIEEKWQRHGGSGALGTPEREEVELGDARGGRRRDFAGSVSSRRGRVTVRQTLPDDATCHRPTIVWTPVAASVYWSEQAGAHVVLGQICDAYLRQGAQAGPLGYPISDERDAADRRGRVSHFEGGDIVWFPDSGAATRLHTFED